MHKTKDFIYPIRDRYTIHGFQIVFLVLSFVGGTVSYNVFCVQKKSLKQEHFLFHV